MPEVPAPLRNIRILLEYDGSAYAGWQRQEGDPSIQEAVENAVAELLGGRVAVTGAGRTDAGVHARGQVANFHTSSDMECRRIAGGLNALLAGDIAVLGCDEVHPSFHSRFDAVGRRYGYTITTVPTAIDRGRAWRVKYRLDPEPMGEAAASIVGRHDFTSFCRAGSGARHHLCDVREASWTADPGRLHFRIVADRFLHGMVRALVGTMVDVGRGFISVPEFRRVLEGRDRSLAGPSAPAAGLVLEQVYY